MSNLEPLLKFTGDWQGKNSLWLSPQDPVRESATNLSIAPAINRKFVEIKYTWADEGKPQEGLLLIGYETKGQLATAAWADSWHMGEKVMNCQGNVNEDGSVDMRGQYQAPPGPDWGWRIVVGPGNQDTLKLVMYNITPEGDEALAVEAIYSRISK
jgi:hypothetical protein